MILVRCLYSAAIIASVWWFWTDPDFEPGIAVLTSVTVLLVDLISRRAAKKRGSQHQKVGAGAVGIQGAGDVTVGNVSVEGGKRDV